MSDDQGKGGGWLEAVIALLLCMAFLLVPMVYIEDSYDEFTAQYGEAKEGAAGTGLALAVVFRTVSRTVLRTIVRTSARAGVRASLKGAMKGAIKNAARSAMRAKTSSVLRDTVDDRPKQRTPTNNWKSLLAASALLYASWIIVIGIGQPYANLLNEEDSIAKQKQEQIEQEQLRIEMSQPAILTWQKEQALKAEQQKLEGLRKDLKVERDIDRQEVLQNRIQAQMQTVTNANYEFSQAFQASKERILDPTAEQNSEVAEASALSSWISYLMTYAPYPGETKWASLILWIGGLVMIIPLWVIFFFQYLTARRFGTVLEHQTEAIGGGIQLYFAGAFSFMPLTSDVVVDTSVENRGKIALAGIVPPTLIAIGLWFVWKETHVKEVLFVADAFLLYPMVQIFPLDPLEGIHLFRWRKLVWLPLFLLVMGAFLLAGSEALKSVI